MTSNSSTFVPGSSKFPKNGVSKYHAYPALLPTKSSFTFFFPHALEIRLQPHSHKQKNFLQKKNIHAYIAAINSRAPTEFPFCLPVILTLHQTAFSPAFSISLLYTPCILLAPKSRPHRNFVPRHVYNPLIGLALTFPCYT